MRFLCPFLLLLSLCLSLQAEVEVTQIQLTRAINVVDSQVKNLASNPNDDDAMADLVGQLSLVLAELQKQIDFVPVNDTEVAQLGENDLARFWRRRRSDIQGGAGGSSSGSTSTVLNPLLPATFGFAIENGALTRSIDGTTTTIKINPAGLLCASRVQPDNPFLRDIAPSAALRQTGCADGWRRVAATVSFDNSRGQTPNVAQGVQPLGNQFAEAKVSIELINRRTPESASFQNHVAEWRRRAQPLADVSNRINAKLTDLGITQGLAGRLKLVLDAQTDAEQREQAIRQVLSSFLAETFGKLDEEVMANLRRERSLWLDALKASDGLYNDFAHGLAITLEAGVQRPDVATEAINGTVEAGMRPPSLWTTRLVAAKGLRKLNVDLTVNVSSSWFSDTRPGMDGSWRDFQFSGDAKFRLRDIPQFGTPTLSLAGLWMHLHQRPLGISFTTLNEQTVNKPGNIGIFQAKLEFPSGNGAMRIPLSFTYASRTELIDETDVRGQIGISLNLDTLFGNPSPQP